MIKFTLFMYFDAKLEKKTNPLILLFFFTYSYVCKRQIVQNNEYNPTLVNKYQKGETNQLQKYNSMQLK